MLRSSKKSHQKKSAPKSTAAKNADKDVYTLHIDVAPHYVHTKEHLAQKELEKKVKEQKAPKHESIEHIKDISVDSSETQNTKYKNTGFLRKLWDKVEFIAVSGAVFGVIYVALNWSALYENALHYYDVWRGYESPLEQVTANSPQVAERLSEVNGSGELRGTNESGVPPLGIEVFPPDMRIIIPRINKNVPVVGVRNENLIARRWEELESDIQGALKSGVVHYPGTALPGENGNVVITGHSSYYAWDAGRFKDVFALLHDVNEGDKVVVFFNQKKYIYQINERKVVLPKDIDVLSASNQEQLTLITCTPIGTNLKRLILVGKLVETSV